MRRLVGRASEPAPPKEPYAWPPSKRSPEKGPLKVTLCVDAEGLPNPSLHFSDGHTVKPKPWTHKPADSVLPVGKGTRFCRQRDVTGGVVKRGASIG